MKKFFIGVLFLLVVATLFSYSAVLSATQEELEEKLQKITNGGKIYEYITLAEDGTPLSKSSNFIYKFNKNIKDYYNTNTGCINIDGVDYRLQITYSNDSVICDSAMVNLDGEGNYFVEVLTKPDGEGEYKFSLTPLSDSDEPGVTATTTVTGNISADKPLKAKISGNTDDGWVLSTIKNLVSELLCAIILPAGDSYLHMLSLAIGEVVTIDRVVYGDVKKIDIDFFETSSGDVSATTTSKPIKDILSGTINKWYGLFRNFVLAFYMGVLVYFGIKILLTSTANKKAVYKRILTAWVMGIAMLMFFPYVMKYTIKLNYAFCKAIQGGDASKESIQITTSLKRAAKLYGNDGFIMMMLGSDKSDEEFAATAVVDGDFSGNSMMYIRFIADHTTNVPLAIIYLIMIGEILALLVMYYKRVFMIAFLITIFPLAVAFYPFSKTGDIKMNTFGVWFKEFVVNVFVQSFHAVTYVVVVSTAVSSYAENVSNGNWLFMIICILFLFEGEKIIRGIFNAKSSINSIGDLAASGMLAMNMAKNVTKFMPNIPGQKKKNDGNADQKATSDRPAPAQPGANTPVASTPGANTPGAQSNANAINSLSNTNNSGATLGRAQGVTVSSANKSLNDNADSARSRSGWANKIAGAVGGGANMFAQTVGTVNGFAMGMAQNDGRGPSGLEKGISSAIQGKSQGKLIGQGASNIITGAVGKVTAVTAGRALAKEYADGEHDDEIFTEADKQMDDIKKQALREAYAKAAKSRAAGFENSAEIKIIKERIDQTKN